MTSPTPASSPRPWLRRRLVLPLADFAAVHLGWYLAYVVRYRFEVGGDIGPSNLLPWSVYQPWGIVLAAMIVVLCALEGLYTRRRNTPWFEVVYEQATSTIVGVAILTIVLYGVRPLAQSRLMLPYAAVATVLVLALVRVGDGAWQRWQRRRGIGVQRTLIVGAGEAGRAVMRNLLARPSLGYDVVGFLDDHPDKLDKAIGRWAPLGSTRQLGRLLREGGVDLVILALPWTARERIAHMVADCEARGVGVRIVPDLFQLSLNRVDSDALGGVPLLAVRQPVIQGWRLRLKRAIDVGFSLVSLTLTAPVLALTALAIRLEGPGPIFFRQTRVGRHGRDFTFFKFRSMVPGAEEVLPDLQAHNEAEGPIFKMRADPRVTRVGRWIRRLSIDELPQLLNVLRGDMSLVGPRPPLPSEVASYQPWHRRRLDVAPGMTGLWQVSGRSKLTFDEMVMLDLYYAENWSLMLDLRILLRTVPTVLLGTGAY
ncbi:MAG: sugar transferase [Ardenticatenales bacterium]|nr:sugar transferase [Ardenticatenales bacterium]